MTRWKEALNSLRDVAFRSDLEAAIRNFPGTIEHTADCDQFSLAKHAFLMEMSDIRQLKPNMYDASTARALGEACAQIDLRRTNEWERDVVISSDAVEVLELSSRDSQLALAIAAPPNLSAAIAPAVGRAKCRLAYYDAAIVAVLAGVVLGMTLAERPFGPFFALDVVLLILATAHLAIVASHNNCATACCGSCCSSLHWRLFSRRIELLLFEVYFFLFFFTAAVGAVGFVVFACFVPERVDSFCAGGHGCPAKDSATRDFVYVSAIFGVLFSASGFVALNAAGIYLTRAYSSMLIVGASGDGRFRWCSKPVWCGATDSEGNGGAGSDCTAPGAIAIEFAADDASFATAIEMGDTAGAPPPGAAVEEFGPAKFAVEISTRAGGTIPTATREGLHTPLTCVTDAVAWHVLPGPLCCRKHATLWKSWAANSKHCCSECAASAGDIVAASAKVITLGAVVLCGGICCLLCIFGPCVPCPFLCPRPSFLARGLDTASSTVRTRSPPSAFCLCPTVLLFRPPVFRLPTFLRLRPSFLPPSSLPPSSITPSPRYIVNTTFSALCIEHAYEDSVKYHPSFNRTYAQWVDPQSYCATANLLWWLLTVWLDIIFFILLIFGSGSNSSSSHQSSYLRRWSPLSQQQQPSDYTDNLVEQQEFNLYLAYGIPGGIIALLLCVGCVGLAVVAGLKLLVRDK